MKDLNRIYQDQLKSNFHSLESKRKKVMYWYILSCICYAFAAGSFISIFITNNVSSTFVYSIPGVIVIGIFLRIQGSKRKKPYYEEFKETVVPDIIHAFNPEWKYTSDGHIGSIVFKSSRLFNKAYEKYEGDDSIQGQIEGINFKCSDLRVGYYTEETDDDGDRKNVYNSIFGGKFFYAEFNHAFEGETHIIYSDLRMQFDALRNTSVKGSIRGSLVQMADKYFSKTYKVYSNNRKEAEKIVNLYVREALVNYYEKQKHWVNISVVGKRLYVAISTKDMFEPRIFKSGVSFKEIERLLQMFDLYETLVRNLKE